MIRRILPALLCLCAISAAAQTITVTASGNTIATLPASSYVIVTASNLRDATGQSPLNGQICFAPVDSHANPWNVSLQGMGQVGTAPACASVVGGAITGNVATGGSPFTLANTTKTYPANLCYNVTATQSSDGSTTLGGGTSSFNSGYNCVQVNNSWCSTVAGVETCNLDSYPPDTPALAATSAPNLSIGTVTTASAGVAAAATVAGTSPNYTLSFTLPQGRGFTQKGAWASGTSYSNNDSGNYDCVTYQGSAYCAKSAFTSGATFNAANWNLLAQQGPAGTAVAGGTLNQVQVNNGAGQMAASPATINAAGDINTPGVLQARNQTFPGLDAVGDSICYGFALSAPQTEAFEYLLGSDLGGTNNNLCVSGQYILDEPLQILNAAAGPVLPTVGANPTYLEEGGKNDADYCQAGAACNSNSQMALQAVVALWGTTNYVAPAAAIKFGTWAADATIGACQATTTNAASISYQITTYNGSPIYVLAENSASNGGTASVTIDGVAQTALTLNGSGETAYGTGWTVFAYPYAVVSGTHTVTIAATSTTGSGNVVGSCGVSSGNNPNVLDNPGAPRLNVMEVLPRQLNIYPTWASTINTMKQDVVTTMAAQGFNVQWQPIVNVPYTGAFDDVGGISDQADEAISAWTCTGTSCTFTVSSNNIQPTVTAQLSGFTATSALNGQTGTVTAVTSTSVTLALAFPAGSGTETGSISEIDSDGTACVSTTTDNIHPNVCGHKQIYRALLHDLSPLTGGAAASTPASHIACASRTTSVSTALSSSDCYTYVLAPGVTISLPTYAPMGTTETIVTAAGGTAAVSGNVLAGITSIASHQSATYACYLNGSTCNWWGIGGTFAHFSGGSGTAASQSDTYFLNGGSLAIPALVPNMRILLVNNNNVSSATITAGAGMSIEAGVLTTLAPSQSEIVVTGNAGNTLWPVASSTVTAASQTLVLSADGSASSNYNLYFTAGHNLTIPQLATYQRIVVVNNGATATTLAAGTGISFQATVGKVIPPNTSEVLQASGDGAFLWPASGAVGVSLIQTDKAGSCTTGATVGSSCATPITVTWPVPFPDGSYTVTCTPLGNAAGVPGVPYLVSASQTASSVQVNYMALTAAAASWAGVWCAAVHP